MAANGQVREEENVKKSLAIDAVSAFARKGIQIFDINVWLIDRTVLSSIYSSSLLSQLCLIKVNHLFTLSHFHLFQIDVM